MPAPRRNRRSGSRVLPLFLILVAVLIAWLGPRFVRGHAAMEWTRYHAAQAPDPFGQHARGVAQAAAQTLDAIAPLPWGADACRLALDFGARQEASNPAAALALYERVRASIEASSRARRGLGLGLLLDEARQREQALRARSDIVKP